MTRKVLIEQIRRILYGGVPNDDASISENEINIYLNEALALMAKINYTDAIKLDGIETVSDVFYATFSGLAISKDNTTGDNYAVKRVGADKIYSYVGNAIDDPTTTNPIYTEIGTNFKFFPASLTSVKIIYFKAPAEAKWAYTGDLVYDAGNSVQLEWPLNDYNDIIYRTLGIIGINLKDGDLIRVSQTVKNDGQ